MVKDYTLKELEEMIDSLDLTNTVPKDKQDDESLFTNLCLSLWQELTKKEKAPFEKLIDHLSLLPQSKMILPPKKIKNFLMCRGVEKEPAELLENKIAGSFPEINLNVGTAERDEAIRLLWRELIKVIQIFGPICFDKKTDRHSAKIVTLISSSRTDKKLVAAKLARQYASEFKKRIMIISLEKTPTTQQTSANLAEKIPYKVVFSRDELEYLLKEEVNENDLIIIDCFGCGLDSWNEIDLLGRMLDIPFEVETHLVIDALTKNVDAARIIKNYLPLSPASYILTGFNETHEPGLLVNLCMNNRLPISYITNDAEVNKPLEIADAPILARYLLTGAMP